MFLIFFLACGPKIELKHDPAAHQRTTLLFEGHISAIGGREAFLSKKSIEIKGRIRTLDAPVSFSFHTIKQAPRSLWTEVSTTDGLKKTRGWNGHVGWNEQGLLLPEQSESMREAEDFYHPLDYKDQYPQTFRIAATNFAGRPCTAALLQSNNGEIEEIFFDQSTKLIVGLARWHKGKAKHWYRYGHYTNIDGVKHPLSIEEKYGKQHKVVLIESIKWNIEHKPIQPPTRY